jgi:hypothetical protein
VGLASCYIFHRGTLISNNDKQVYDRRLCDAMENGKFGEDLLYENVDVPCGRDGSLRKRSCVNANVVTLDLAATGAERILNL